MPSGSKTEALRRVVVLECKSGALSAWVVRQARSVRFGPSAVYILSHRADEFISANRRIIQWHLGIPEPTGFSVITVGKPADDKSERAPAFNALQQCVSAAQGALGHFQSLGSCIVFPVVVTTAPLFTLTYANEEPDLASVQWARVLFSGVHRLGGPTLVDVVGHEHLPGYLRNVLRPALEDLSESMLERGWTPDQ